MTDESLPLVTIGMPTYNRAAGLLPKALESAIAQTYSNVEIVISDNASPDHTEDLVKGYADPRIRYFKHEQSIGFRNNFNFCIKEAKGSYFLLLCDDDLIDPDMIESCMQAVRFKTDVGVILTGARQINEHAEVDWESPNKLQEGSLTDFFFNWFNDRVPLFLCSTLYNTEGLRQIGLFHSKTDLFFDVVATAKLADLMGMANVHDVKASFRRHTTNTAGSSIRLFDWCEDCLYLLDVMCELADDNKKDQLRKKGLWWFCRKNYQMASTITAPMERFAAFRKVNEIFENSYSPLQFYYNTKVRSKLRNLKSSVKRNLLGR